MTASPAIGYSLYLEMSTAQLLILKAQYRQILSILPNRHSTRGFNFPADTMRARQQLDAINRVLKGRLHPTRKPLKEFQY